jgi:curved DNA-binding protein CbpA
MGQVSEFPLIEILREIGAHSLSGAVRLERGLARGVVYFEAGKPIFAASNIKDLRLGEYLTKRGLVSQEQLPSNKNISDTVLIKELLQRKTLDATVLAQASLSLVNDVIRVLLLWTDGSWEFDQRARLADSNSFPIDTTSLLLVAARTMDPTFIATRLRDPAEVISPASETRTDEDLLPPEGFVLSRLDGPMRLDELLAVSGQPDEVGRQIIYGLALCGFIKREKWPIAIAQTSARKQPPKQVTPEPDPEPADTAERDLEVFLNRVESAQTHYEVLDTTSSAPGDDIKRGYYALARRYHPDRFHGNVQVHRRTESAFARITQAYEVLTDPGRRSAYDAKLAAREKVRSIADAAPQSRTQTESNTSSSVSPEKNSAEMNFREGYAALQMGQVNQAIQLLAAAANNAPNEPRYRAYYGKALAASGTGKRMAETELQAAIKLEPNNASYHLMLAQLYYDLGFLRRARAEAVRAFELDPKHPDAQSLLRKMEDK